MSPQDDQEMRQWVEEVDRRSDFILETQDALARSVEFQTLAHAYAESPRSMRPEALRRVADFAVLFVTKQEGRT